MEDKTEFLKKYEKYMRRNELSENTIKSYLWTANFFLDEYCDTTRRNVLDYKEKLMQKHKKPTTINQRLQALNYMLR